MGSSLLIGGSIYLFNGNIEFEDTFYIQRIDIDETDTFGGVEVLGSHTFKSKYPPIFEVGTGFCV